MYVIGIDPGISGAICFLEDGKIIDTNSLGYGHLYNFETFFNTVTPRGRGVVLPSVDPSCFEIKNPDTDIKGVVN